MRAISVRSLIIVSCLSSFFFLSPFFCTVDSDWFLKSSSGDSQYIKLEDVTGIVSTTEIFTANVSANAYIKVLGNTGISPWLIEDSDWYFDLYLRSSTSGTWELVKSHGFDTFPSSTVPVSAGVPAELKAIVYYPTDFDTVLSVDTFPDRVSLSCVDTMNYPESGVVKIDDELIRYSSKSYSGILDGIERGYSGTTPEFHSIGSKVSFYSGFFKIPIVIALEQVGSSGGSGGGMHPSRSHILMLSISEGTPPVALATVSKWYHMVTCDASDSYDEDGVIVSYQWDWDSDGIWDAEGVHVKHNYSDEGKCFIRLKVTDNDGMSSENEYEVDIIFPPKKKMGVLTDVFGLPMAAWIVIAMSLIFTIYVFLRRHNGQYSRGTPYTRARRNRFP